MTFALAQATLTSGNAYSPAHVYREAVPQLGPALARASELPWGADPPNADYEGQSLAMLERIAEALHLEVQLRLVPAF
ncbi:MAG: hypothetical protein WD851_04640 [Pirellulales bacterium]